MASRKMKKIYNLGPNVDLQQIVGGGVPTAMPIMSLTLLKSMYSSL